MPGLIARGTACLLIGADGRICMRRTEYMISSKSDYKEYLSYEKNIYFNDVNGSPMHAFIMCSKFWKMWKYVKTLRTAEYHKNCGHKLRFALWHRRKHRLGNKLGFEIPENCTGKGLTIYHISPVIINEEARIGEDFKISGNFCAGRTDKGAPVIGNGVEAGWGSCVIGNVKIADGVILGAGCVAVKDIDIAGASAAGVPAAVIEH